MYILGRTRDLKGSQHRKTQENNKKAKRYLFKKKKREKKLERGRTQESLPDNSPVGFSEANSRGISGLLHRLLMYKSGQKVSDV